MDLNTIAGSGGEWMPVEQELIDKAKAGDRVALNEIVIQCWQPLYRFVSYKTGNPEDAQDLVQETFFRAFRALSSYTATDNRFSGWLNRIATNLITDNWRKKARSPVDIHISLNADNFPAKSDPAEEVVNEETRKALAEMLNELPDDQRRTVELRILAGLPVRDTALALKKSEAAVKMLQLRALKTLREKLLSRGVLTINEK